MCKEKPNTGFVDEQVKGTEILPPNRTITFSKGPGLTYVNIKPKFTFGKKLYAVILIMPCLPFFLTKKMYAARFENTLVTLKLKEHLSL